MCFTDLNQDSQTPRAVEGLWERGSRREERQRRPRAAALKKLSALAGVPVGLPALTRALKLQDKASKVGFDWNDPRAVLHKIRQGSRRIEAALDGDATAAAGEVGDLFAAVNLARHLRADPEAVLRVYQPEIRAPFRGDRPGAGRSTKKPLDATLAEMDALWDAAKAQE